MAPLKIEVTGEASIYRPAERAIVSISVQSEGSSQERVSIDVSSASAQLRELLTSLAGKGNNNEASTSTASVTNWSNSTLSTGSYFKYDNDGNRGARVYQASMSFEAKFRDFAKLGSVATTLSTMEYVSIGNISWSLTDETKLGITQECRYQAVRDAVLKAHDFAKALGRDAPPVTEIRDSLGGGPVTRFAEARFMAAAPGQEELNFTPEKVSVNCSVTVICEEK